MHMQPVFSGARAFIDGTAEHLFSTGLTLPKPPPCSPSWARAADYD